MSAEGRNGRRRDWDGLAAVIAALVGFLALAVSAYTAYVQRQQTRAQVWPRLELGMQPSERQMTLTNKGVGPAIMRDVRMYVDGKVQPDWPRLFQALGLHYDPPPPASTLGYRVIAPGETIRVVKFASDGDFERLMAVRRRLAVSLCYCSVLDDCWQFDEREAAAARLTLPAERCPAGSADSFTQ